MRIIFYIAALFILTIAPAMAEEIALEHKTVHEECFDMEEGQVLSYSFSTTGKVDFNIHYHDENDKTLYLVEEHKVKVSDSLITVPVSQKYCVMWINRHWASINIEYELGTKSNAEEITSGTDDFKEN